VAVAKIQIRYWAAAKEAAGLAEEDVTAATLAEALDVARARHDENPRFAAVLARSSFLVDGAQAGRHAAEKVVLADGSVVEVLPAFAGG
jgi:sulfur-carrier protein